MPASLPILERRAEIEQAIRAHQITIICGETGSGKTTQLPQICLALNPRTVIAHTQPRRIAARAVAARIAEETGTAVGGLVGVKVRFHEQTSRETRIKLVTDGMLLAELVSDPELRAYSTIIIDEAHERSLNIDFILGYLRTLLPRRPDLKLLVTSATIDPKRFSDYFGGPKVAPVIEVSGRTYPVEIRYRPTSDDEEEFERLEVEAVADAVEELTRPSLPEGDVLVFLPGEREIRLSADAVRRRGVSAEILPLFARLSSQEQDRIFHPSGMRRVILSTNVAETSLTVPGIRYVVDTGLARLSRYDPERKVQRLPIESISRASAAQRSGRCGRLSDGVCVRLYSESSFAARPLFTDPEIRRTNLASVVLQMKSLGLPPIDRFPFLDPPDAAAITDAYETLFELGAIDSHEPGAALTPIGRDMARLPLDPRVARMLLAGDREGCLREVVVLAAALSIQDPRERPMGRHDDADRAQLVFRNETSDFLTLLNLWDQYAHESRNAGNADLRDWCRQRFVSAARMREWGETIHQLRDIAEELELKPRAGAATPDSVHRALLTGLITNVACREDAASFDYRGVRGNTLAIFPGSALFKKAPKWIMAAEIVHTTRLYARTVAKIDLSWLEELAGHMFQRRLSDKHLDADTGQPSAFERVTMSGIVVVPRRRASLVEADPTGARALFLLEALAQCKWKTDAPFMRHNRAVLEAAREAEAKLRRRGLLRSDDDVAEWFDQRVARHVADPTAFEAWRSTAERADARVFMLSLTDVLLPSAHAALDEASFPNALMLDDATEHPLTYRWSAGHDDDGVTLTLPLAALPFLTPERAAWLVPGMLPDLLQALLKTLPKPPRAELEMKGDGAELAAACAGVMDFGAGSLLGAFAEAIEVLYTVRVDPSVFVVKALPAHLRLRVRVVDEHAKELAADRDLEVLLARFEGRLRKLQAAHARAGFERASVTTWDFGDLPDSVEVERAGEQVTMYPALVETGDHVRLTLVETAADAVVLTPRGVRRLFVIALRDELAPALHAQPEWKDAARHYQQLGTPARLLDEVLCIIAERACLVARAVPRTGREFEERLTEARPRLHQVTRETLQLVAAVLDTRAKIAQRLSGGTPRLWADSVADIREHAAYLLPAGFLRHVAWEHLRHYPRYVEAMRGRLFSLREGGSNVEKTALQQFAPHWKRFTGWVAGAMSARREREAEPAAATGKAVRAPLPQTRRNSPTVNVDAGAWAIVPGNLPAGVEQYRWGLEEARLALFAPELAAKPGMSLVQVEGMWKRVEAT